MINVRDYGAKGDGVNDDTRAIQDALDAAYDGHGGSEGRYANESVFFPNGWYITSAPLRLDEVAGANIYGEGRLATTIQNNTPDSSVFVTNGFMYSRVEGFSFTTANGSGAAFDMNWDNSGTASLQSNTFSDVSFGGNGDFGLKIGAGGYMGSEILLLNCYFSGKVAGLHLGNYNAISVTVIGGNIAPCGKGVWIENGGCCTINGTGFQRNDIDIHIQNGVQDGWAILNCRTESDNIFLMAQPDSRVAVVGCTQTGGKYFLKDCGSDISVINCYSGGGKIHGSSKLSVMNSRFDNPEWNEWYGSISQSLSGLPFMSKVENTDVKAAFSGTIFDNNGAISEVVFVLPVDDETSYRIPAGTWFGFYVATENLMCIRGSNIVIGNKSADRIMSDVVGSYIELMCVVDGGSKWIARTFTGEWD